MMIRDCTIPLKIVICPFLRDILSYNWWFFLFIYLWLITWCLNNYQHWWWDSPYIFTNYENCHVILYTAAAGLLHCLYQLMFALFLLFPLISVCRFDAEENFTIHFPMYNVSFNPYKKKYNLHVSSKLGLLFSCKTLFLVIRAFENTLKKRFY